MKKIILISLTLCLGFVSLVSAEEISEEENDCFRKGLYARFLMSDRQKGVSLSLAMDNYKVGLEKKVIVEAYEQNLYSSKEIKEKVIKEFENGIVIKCLKELY